MDSKIYPVLTRLKQRDPALGGFYLDLKGCVDSDVTELIDYLLFNFNAVNYMCLTSNHFTDEIGVKLARYVAHSSIIVLLRLTHNKIETPTYLALANALCTNSSLRELYLCDNTFSSRAVIDITFINALRLNLHRPSESKWLLYTFEYPYRDFHRLKCVAEKMTSPSMLEFLLHVHSDFEQIKSTKH